jgi:succinate dehydrogenase / fumarate reductase cytochrome b subunit
MKKNRPLSPHLQVYRLPLTAVLSISHRISGCILSLSTAGIVILLALLMFEPFVYDQVLDCLKTPVGAIVVVGFVLAFWYHFCAGLRHLIWDMGYGYDLPAVKTSNSLQVVLCLIFNDLLWGVPRVWVLPVLEQGIGGP